MKITMLTTMCGPEGNAYPGTVIDLPQKEAEHYLAKRFARKYDNDRDKKAKKGPIKYVRTQK